MNEKNIIEIISMFVFLITIPLLFRVKNYFYIKMGYEIKKSEEIIFLLISFIVLISLAWYFDSRFLFFISLPFLVWYLIPVMKWELSLWRKQ
jgi:hypothetical protein